MPSLLHKTAKDSVKPSESNALKRNHFSAENLINAFQSVRHTTENLIVDLGPEDQNIQAMPEASPIKWHRAHTSWFFETFVLKKFKPEWSWVNPLYCELFNSYYNGIGRQHPRALRSLISRPDHREVSSYRATIDDAVVDLIERTDPTHWDALASLILTGINHEQQHQELIITDYKACLPHNPLATALGQTAEPSDVRSPELVWIRFKGGPVTIGLPNDHEGFAFDNEFPAHTVHLNSDYELAHRPVNCGEFMQFIEAGGYRNPDLWLSDGWAWVQQHQIQCPLYWFQHGQHWFQHTLTGKNRIRPQDPVCHLSLYEAMAYAQWQDARLPSEAEWEQAARQHAPPIEGHFADLQRYHPEPADSTSSVALQQLFGTVWEWTQSSYAPYPGFRAAEGAIGEYNGKFMANQMVLRGGSCATPAGHVRPSYRNFFYPNDRWQFSGLRLARDCE